MVERSAVPPIAAEPVDEAELEIGCEELAGVRVVGERTKTRAGVILPVVLEVGEERQGAGGAVDLPNRARPPANTKLARHPLRARFAFDKSHALGRDDLQSKQRSCSNVDVGCFARGIAVERNAEHLPYVASGGAVAGRRVGDLSAGGPAELGQVENLQHGAARVDEGAVDRKHVRRHFAPHFRTGKTRNRGIAWADDGRALRACIGQGQRKACAEERRNPRSSDVRPAARGEKVCQSAQQTRDLETCSKHL